MTIAIHLHVTLSLLFFHHCLLTVSRMPAIFVLADLASHLSLVRTTRVFLKAVETSRPNDCLSKLFRGTFRIQLRSEYDAKGIGLVGLFSNILFAQKFARCTIKYLQQHKNK